MTWPYTDGPRPSPPQVNQCLLSHFLTSLGAQEKTDCTSMLWSVDSCQNKVSADQYHLTVSRAQVSTHRGQVFFEVIRWQGTSFQMIAGSSLSKIYMKYVVFMCRTIKILISNWPRMRKFSQLLQAGKTVAFDFSHLWSPVGHALHPIFMLWLVKIWQLSSCGKFMQHLETCLLWQLKLTEFCVNLWCF